MKELAGATWSCTSPDSLVLVSERPPAEGWFSRWFGGGGPVKVRLRSARFKAEAGAVDVGPALRFLAASLNNAGGGMIPTVQVGALPGLDPFAQIGIVRRLVEAEILRVIAEQPK